MAARTVFLRHAHHPGDLPDPCPQPREGGGSQPSSPRSPPSSSLARLELGSTGEGQFSGSDRVGFHLPPTRFRLDLHAVHCPTVTAGASSPAVWGRCEQPRQSPRPTTWPRGLSRPPTLLLHQ